MSLSSMFSTRRAWWWLFVALALVEFVVFDVMTAKHYAHRYPAWTDQSYYLTDAYTGYEAMKAHGFFSGLAHVATAPIPQGRVHALVSAILFWVIGGPSRSAALSLNMLVFVAWQLALVLALRSRQRPWWFVALVFFLPLALQRPWEDSAGSAIDFRLDHAAMCLMGIAAACGWASRGFRSRAWSIAFGLVVGVTIATRFLTATYLLLILAALVIGTSLGSERRRRIGHLAIAAVMAGVIAGLAFCPSRDSAYHYYVVGHLHSAEGDARDPGLGAWQSVQFIGESMAVGQLGFCWLLVVILLTSWWAGRCWEQPPLRRAPPVLREDLLLDLSFVLLPALVLGIHRQKSEFVLGVIVPGLVLLLADAWWSMNQRLEASGSRPGFHTRQARWLTAFAVLASGGYFGYREFSAPDPATLFSARQVRWLLDRIEVTARSAHLSSPRIGATEVMDFLDAQMLTVFSYEKNKTWKPFVAELPTNIVTEDEHEIMRRLAACDFVLLVDCSTSEGYYPFDRELRRMYPQVKAWCEENMRRVDGFEIFGRQISLYQRRDLPIAQLLPPPTQRRLAWND